MPMNNYSAGDFNADAIVVARNLHVTYNRCKILLDRWNDGLSAVTTDGATQLLMVFVAAFVAKCQAAGEYGGIELDYILNMSDLKLPGDAE